MAATRVGLVKHEDYTPSSEQRVTVYILLVFCYLLLGFCLFSVWAKVNLV